MASCCCTNRNTEAQAYGSYQFLSRRKCIRQHHYVAWQIPIQAGAYVDRTSIFELNDNTDDKPKVPDSKFLKGLYVSYKEFDDNNELGFAKLVGALEALKHSRRGADNQIHIVALLFSEAIRFLPVLRRHIMTLDAYYNSWRVVRWFGLMVRSWDEMTKHARRYLAANNNVAPERMGVRH